MITTSEIINAFGQYGLYRLARRITMNSPRILMYHRFSNSPKEGYISSETFETQIRYLKKHYNLINLSDLTKKIKQGEELRNCIAITVDDGYADFYEVAYPILERYEVPATLFVTTGFVSGELWLWPDKITWMLSQVNHISNEIEIGTVVMARGEVNKKLKKYYWGELIGFLLSIDDKEKHRRIKQLGLALGVDLPHSAPAEFLAVTWPQLKEIQETGIEIGGHTVSHPSLGSVTSDEALHEIMRCYHDIDDHLGQSERSFCYPNGTRADYTDETMSIVRQVGFINAVVAFHDHKGLSEHYSLRRHSAGEDMFQFYKSASGLEYLGDKLRAFIGYTHSA